jgi:hypothetical protein
MKKNKTIFYLDEYTPLSFDEAIDYLQELLYQEKQINSQLRQENEELYSNIMKLKVIIDMILEKNNLPF